jgi:hypothetical protein
MLWYHRSMYHRKISVNVAVWLFDDVAIMSVMPSTLGWFD